MDLFASMWNEFTSAFTGGSVGGFILGGTYISIILLALVGLCKGWLRGGSRAASRFLTVAFAMGLTLYLTMQVFPYFSTLCDGKTLLEVMQALRLDGLISAEGVALSVLRNMEGESLVLLAALPASIIIIPVVMVVCFILSSALLLIVHGLICGIFGWKSHCTTTVGRFVGALFGLVQGTAVALFLCIPLFSGIGYMGAVCDASPETSKLTVSYDTYMRQTDDSALAQTVRQFGGDQLMGLVENQMMYDGEKIDLDSLASSAGAMLAQMQFLSDADFKALTPAQQDAMREIVNIAEDSQQAQAILASLMRVSAKTLSEYEDRLPFEEPFLSTLQEFISYFGNDLEDAYAVKDLSTFIEVYIVLMNSDVLNQMSDPEATTEVLKNSSGALRTSVNILKANRRTTHLADSVMRFAVAAVATSLPDDAAVLYASVSEDLRTCVGEVNDGGLTGNAYKEALTDALTDVFEENGLTVTQEGAAAMAEHIADGNNEVDTWTEADVREALLSYFESQSSSAE